MLCAVLVIIPGFLPSKEQKLDITYFMSSRVSAN